MIVSVQACGSEVTASDSSARVFQDVLHRVLKKMGFEELTEGPKTKRYITFHCLRHTFASHWMMNGGDVFKLQKILGHKSVQMTMRYAHLAPEAFASDYGRFGTAPSNATATVTDLDPASPSTVPIASNDR